MPLAETIGGLLAGLKGLGGTLLLFPVMLPLTGLLLAIPLGGRRAGRIVLALLPVGLLAAVAIAAAVLDAGAPLHYDLGGWAPPLGVTLQADGLSATLLLTTAVVMLAVGLYAQPGFRVPGRVVRDPPRPSPSGRCCWASGVA